MLFILLTNIKMPTIVGILMFMSKISSCLADLSVKIVGILMFMGKKISHSVDLSVKKVLYPQSKVSECLEVYMSLIQGIDIQWL